MGDFFLLDSSALIKLYERVPTPARAVMWEILGKAPESCQIMLCRSSTVVDTFFQIRKMRDRGKISAEEFDKSWEHFHDFVSRPDILNEYLTKEQLMLTSIDFIEKYNITYYPHCLILCCAIDKAVECGERFDEFTFVSCNRKLIEIAESAGVVCLNPNDFGDVTHEDALP